MSTREYPTATNSPDRARGPYPPSPLNRRRLVTGALLLSAVCLANYANALSNPFHRDDVSILRQDPRIGGLRIGELLTGNYWYIGDTDRLYRPLVMVSFAVNWAISPEPWAFRVPNLLAHAGVCAVLLALAWRVFGSYRAALIGALFFAIHPLHTEPLNTIVGRADLLAALFMLGAALLYWDDAPVDKGRLWRPLAAAVLAAAGLLCKENAVTLPAVVALFDWWRVRCGQRAQLRSFLARRLRRCYLPMLLLIAGYLLLRWHLFGLLAAGTESINAYDNPIAHPALGLHEGDSVLLARWATPLATLAKAVRLHLLPDRLCTDYSHAAIQTVRRLSDGRLWAGLALLLLAGLACLASCRRRLGFEVPILFSAITYSIVSNAPVVIGTIFGERLLYLPSAGYCMLLGLLADYALRPRSDQPSGRPRPLGTALASVLALAAVWYTYLSVNRNRDWRSEEALCASSYRVNPRSCKVLAGMASISLRRGELRRALAYAAEATEIAPRYWPAWRNAALALRHLADQTTDPQRKQALADRALDCYRHTLGLGGGGDTLAMLGTASLLVERGDYAGAIGLLEQFIQNRPREHRAYNDLAYYLVEAQPVELRNPPRALAHIRSALDLRPGVADCVDTLAAVLMALDRPAEAAGAIREAIAELPPDSPGVEMLTRRLQEIERSSPAPAGN